MGIDVTTVADLISALQKFPAETPVGATWEGVWRDIAVYRDKQGECVIDADGCMYEKDFSDGSPEFQSPTGAPQT